MSFQKLKTSEFGQQKKEMQKEIPQLLRKPQAMWLMFMCEQRKFR